MGEAPRARRESSPSLECDSFLSVSCAPSFNNIRGARGNIKLKPSILACKSLFRRHSFRLGVGDGRVRVGERCVSCCCVFVGANNSSKAPSAPYLLTRSATRAQQIPLTRIRLPDLANEIHKTRAFYFEIFLSRLSSCELAPPKPILIVFVWRQRRGAFLHSFHRWRNSSLDSSPFPGLIDSEDLLLLGLSPLRFCVLN